MLSGCWSKMELTERAFVLAIAIDKGEKDNLELTVQIYRPVSQFGAPSVKEEKSAFVNVTLEGPSIFSIIRKNTAVTGRRSQFSHTQILIISEEIAKEGLSGILDFFFRDPEIRLNTSVIIAKGKARDYLTGKPLIENTLGSQIEKQLDFSTSVAGMTIKANLLDLAFQLKNESESAMLPYIIRDRKFQQDLTQGIALVKKDKMIGWIEPSKAGYLLMLADQYKYGVVEIPCDRESSNKPVETFEILKVDTKMNPTIKGNAISVRFDVQIVGSIGDLVCTSIQDMMDEMKYVEKTERYVEEQLESVLKTLQKQNVDALGIGHKLFLQHPSQWKKIKPDWSERYSHISFDTKVKVRILNSKMMNPGPFGQTDKN
jgi:spore germination protein KC